MLVDTLFFYVTFKKYIYNFLLKKNKQRSIFYKYYLLIIINRLLIKKRTIPLNNKNFRYFLKQIFKLGHLVINSSNKIFFSYFIICLVGWMKSTKEGEYWKIDSVKDGDDYNNPSSCLVERNDR